MLEAIIAIVLAITASMTTVAFIAKRMSVSAIATNEAHMDQGKALVNAALKNMEANTEAIKANSIATTALAGTINQQMAIREERDRTMFKQLDRIERGLK